MAALKMSSRTKPRRQRRTSSFSSSSSTGCHRPSRTSAAPLLHLLACAATAALLPAAAAKTLATGGPNPEHWEDRYPGCRQGLELAQLVRRPGEEVLCGGQFETCFQAAAATADLGLRLDGYCRCLSAHKLCVMAQLDTVTTRNGSLAAPLGCPDIALSRLCVTQQAVVLSRLNFHETSIWKCTACAASAGDTDARCLSGLRPTTCDCHFECPAAYNIRETMCHGFRCHSISCLLSLMGCWVADNSCSKLEAWYLCLYDASLVTKDSGGNFMNATRGLGCRLKRCRDAIIHLDPSPMQAYLWVGMFALVFLVSIAVLIVLGSQGRKEYRHVTKQYKLAIKTQHNHADLLQSISKAFD